jgi:hypothetical protein
MAMLDRVKNILLNPKQEWSVIKTEPTPVPDLYRRYIALLAAIGPIASIIGLSVFGVTVPLIGTVRLPLAQSLTQAVVSYVLTLGGVFVLALIVDALAPVFGGIPNRKQALKVIAYASTAAWVAGLFMVLPALSVLGLLLSLYSLYLLYLGLPVLMQSPREKALGYTISVILAALVIFVGIGAITTWLTPSPLSVATKPEQEPRSLGTVEDAAKRFEETFGAAASKSGTAQPSASVDFRQLKTLLPNTLPGFQRTAASGDQTGAFGMTLSKAEGRYESSDNRSIDLTISDIGSMSGLAAMATYAWTASSFDRETDTGYEKTTTFKGYKAYEKYDKDSQDSEIAVMVKDRFVVEAQGNAVKMDELRRVLDQVDLGKLADLKS